MTLPASLIDQIERAGYFPQTALAALERAASRHEVTSFFVHPATTFDGPQVRRHLTVLLLTPRHFIVLHLDDESEDTLNPNQVIVGTERIRHERIHNMGLAQAYNTSGDGVVSDSQAEITIGISWGATRRVDLERAWCDDPNCDADHGYTGTIGPSDLALRVSAIVDGPDAIDRALEFFDDLNLVTA
ncbi:DUF5998 family protein [Helcobacillus massiliensis]|uniref:Phosphodiesterase n=1 Tax=Helcobacillus massiliensis TaxID=521392 RepID=A0A839QWC0_9MICO|nr:MULTISPECIES: DUF5998 family protein [Helcobacillus]MBB3022291.1 hypothetical protein [Helcobacillus massiliensis]MCG7426488.1 DUF5998 family protein [Helcobacillus sp. ACRRO]MCT1556931.1 DUF5998 family protein [Helcobacillus massiliensis]MCT2035320.1 DUF5998 family protein [Helcobacillus massiliensis]MCT2331465.1 DUF5998 family protein [Helcobacillus massiliensis]